MLSPRCPDQAAGPGVVLRERIAGRGEEHRNNDKRSEVGAKTQEGRSEKPVQDVRKDKCDESVAGELVVAVVVLDEVVEALQAIIEQVVVPVRSPDTREEMQVIE